MTTLLLYVLIPLQFVLMSLSPGLFLVRRMGFGAVDRLLAGIGLSWIIHYLLGTAGRLTERPEAGLGIALGITLLALVPSAKELIKVLRCRFARRVMLATGVVTLWAMLLLHAVTNFSGLGWGGDWVEHWQRARFFQNDPAFPPDFVFVNLYALPARPPLQNAVTALLLMPQGDAFSPYMIVMTLLNALATTAALAQLPIFTRRANGVLWIGAALLMLNPMFAENVTYSWTKGFAAFYALAGFRLYQHAIRRARYSDWIFCGLMFSAGCLVHYSIAPYVIVLGLDLLTRLASRPRLIVPALVSAGGAILLGASWLGWSFAWYGMRGTVATNTAVTESVGASSIEMVGRVANNIVVTLVPASLLNPLVFCDGILGRTRDHGFIVYQHTLPFMAGLAGLVVLPLAAKLRLKAPSFCRGVAYVVLVCIVGIAVVGGKQEMGQAHLCLPALVLQGVMLIAATIPAIPRGFRAIVVPLLYLIDLVWGILLHFWIQSASPRFEGDPPAYVDDPNLSLAANQSVAGRIAFVWDFPADGLSHSARALLIVLAAALAGMVFALAWRRSREPQGSLPLNTPST